MEHESYVSLETAKMLRSAGFGWEVRAHYCPKEMPNLLYGRLSLSDKWNGGYYDGCYSAPTLAVAQRWLRERHSLDITITRHNAKGWRAWLENDILPGMKDTEIICQCVTETAPTYEAALEAGLQEALKIVMAKK